MTDILSIAKQFTIGDVNNITPYGKGRINETFLVTAFSKNGEESFDNKYILQKLHQIFTPAVLEDIEVITSRLEKANIVTPKLIRTMKGDLSVNSEGETWRMLTYIGGKTYEYGIDNQKAESAASLIGEFHNALSGLDYKFLHKIPNFHDTRSIMEGLSRITLIYQNTDKYKTLSPLTEEILIQYEKIKDSIEGLPERIIHGDLKLNNIRFDEKGQKAIAIVDLDTLGTGKIVIDIGDAIRSWCHKLVGPDGEDDLFDLDMFRFIMSGYLSTAVFMTREEIKSIPEGVVMMMLELSARYITDAYEESYFRLDSERYANLFEQNKTKAFAQMRLFNDFKKKIGKVDNILIRSK
ncbi:MAG: phosphotransferase [Thermodesulfobacteriota bacterium]